MIDIFNNLNKDQVKTLAAIAAATGVTLYCLTKLTAPPSREEQLLSAIPTPPECYPVVGHLMSLGDLPSVKFAEWHRKHGPILRIRMGAISWISVADPELAYELLVSKGAVTSSRPTNSLTFEHYARKGRGLVFAPNGKKWKNTRTTALQVLSPKSVADLTHDQVKEAARLVEDLVAETKKHDSVDPHLLLQRTTVNFFLKTCFAKHAESLDDPLLKKIVHLVDGGFKLGGSDLGHFLPFMSFFNNNLEKRFTDFLYKYRDGLFNSLIADAIAGDEDCLIKRIDALRTKFDLDDDDLVVISSDLVTAGMDTTSSILYWSLALLVNHPDIQAKLCAELDAFTAVHKRVPLFSDRHELPYMVCFQKETMRYCPPTHFGMFHVPETDVEIRGYTIPKHTNITANLYALNRDPNRFEDPDKFMPERFLTNTRPMASVASGKLESRDHFSFGWGRRVCVGAHVAEAQMYNVLVHILSHCTIEPALDAKGRPIMPDLKQVNTGLIIMPPPYKVRFVPRSSGLA